MNLTRQIKIDTETFTGTTVEVTIGKETRTLRARVNPQDDEGIVCFGLYGMYRTGAKKWDATATTRTDPRTGVTWVDFEFGFESRTGRHSQRPTVGFMD